MGGTRTWRATSPTALCSGLWACWMSPSTARRWERSTTSRVSSQTKRAMNSPMMFPGPGGRHIFKFGVDFATTNDYSFYATNLNGSYTYSNPNAFALDYTGNTSGAKNYTSYSQTFGNPALNTRINDYDFYVED